MDAIEDVTVSLPVIWLPEMRREQVTVGLWIPGGMLIVW